MARKGRANGRVGVPKPEHRGTKHSKNVLTENEVIFIAKSTEGHRSIARRFGVGKTTIRAIRNGTSWGWLTGIQPTRRQQQISPLSI